MKQKHINIAGVVLVAILIIGGYIFYNKEDVSIGAAPRIGQPSQGQTGTSTIPTAGQLLIGNGTNDRYDVSTLTAGSNITITNEDGSITIAGPAGAGEANTVSTSTSETAGRLSYWTSTLGTPALLGEVSTTTIVASTGLSYSGTLGSLVGGVGGNLTVDASQTQITAVGALDAGSITSNFGNIDNGASTIDTTGAVSFGNTVVNTGATLTVTDLTSAMLLTNGSGVLAEYTGTSCTNQFTRALSTLGVATCATVSLTADVSGTLPLANGGTNATTLDDILGTANQITVSAGANTIIGGDATLALASPLTLPIGTTTATNLHVTGDLQVDGVFFAPIALTAGGVLNMGGFAIDNAGVITGTAFVASSATATSTFAGGLTVQTDAFVVQDDSKNIGIGTTTPATLIDVFSTGTTTFTGDSNSVSKGFCMKVKDFDGGGYTYLTTLNGTLLADTVSCE